MPSQKYLIARLKYLEKTAEAVSRCQNQNLTKAWISGFELVAGQALFYVGLAVTYGAVTISSPWIFLSGVILSSGILIAKAALTQNGSGIITTAASANTDRILTALNDPSVLIPSAAKTGLAVTQKALNVFNVVSSANDLSQALSAKCSANLPALKEAVTGLRNEIQSVNDHKHLRRQTLSALRLSLEEEIAMCAPILP